MSNPYDIPYILPVTQRVVTVQGLTLQVDAKILDKAISGIKMRIETAPVGTDTTEWVYMLKAMENFRDYRRKVHEFIEEAGAAGLFDKEDQPDYKHIMSHIAGPGTGTKQ